MSFWNRIHWRSEYRDRHGSLSTLALDMPTEVLDRLKALRKSRGHTGVGETISVALALYEMLVEVEEDQGAVHLHDLAGDPIRVEMR